MPRILAAVCCVLVIMLPATASALRVGDISLKSSLNEPFAAEIALTVDDSRELDGVRVSLADADTFARYGLERPPYLRDFVFATRSEGAAAGSIMISSRQPVTEPFVTILLNIEWPGGRLLREFTVLLDPPVFSAPPPAATPVQPAAPAEPAPAPVTEVTRSEPAPAPAPVQPAPAPAPAEPAPVPRAESSRVTDGSYGPVRRNETLWGIAQRLRPDSSVNINQMMLALYNANPQAFAGNINRLKQGAILRVPDSSEILALSRGEANAEVSRQNSAWKSGEPAAAPAEDSSRLRLVPPAEDAEPAADEAVADSGDSYDAGLGDTSATEGAGDSARVAELEGELEESQRLLDMKDRELQALQQQLKELQGQQAETGFDDVEITDPEIAPAQPDEPVVEEPVAEEPAVEEPTAVEEEQVAEEPASEPSRTVTTSSADDDGGFMSLLTNPLLWGTAAVVLFVALFLSRRRGSSLPQTTSIDPVADLDDDRTVVKPATIKTREPHEPTIVVEEGPSETGTGELGLADDADEELPLERTLSAADGLDLDQADPIAEAEFHMAYGLYDQASELLVKALSEDPGNRTYRMKLLEVYFVWENADSFLNEARAFQDTLDGADDPDWSKVAIMGRQICPDADIFSDAGGSAGVGEEMDFPVDENSATGEHALDLTLGGNEEGEQVIDVAGDTGASGIDFDLGDAADGGTTTMETPTIETDLSASTMETPTMEAEMMAETVETPTIDTPMDMDSTAEMPVGEEPAGDDLDLDLSDLEDLAGDEGGLDLELSDDDATMLADPDEALEQLREESAERDLSGAIPASTEAVFGDTVEQPNPKADDTVEQPALDEDALNADLSDGVDFDLTDAEPPVEDDDVETELAPVPEGGDLPQEATLTEVGTKLDLAKAYVDMGDPDGARSILREVLEEGDSGQQQEAQQLLDRLDD